MSYICLFSSSLCQKNSYLLQTWGSICVYIHVFFKHMWCHSRLGWEMISMSIKEYFRRPRLPLAPLSVTERYRRVMGSLPSLVKTCLLVLMNKGLGVRRRGSNPCSATMWPWPTSFHGSPFPHLSNKDCTNKSNKPTIMPILAHESKPSALAKIGIISLRPCSPSYGPILSWSDCTRILPGSELCTSYPVPDDCSSTPWFLRPPDFPEEMDQLFGAGVWDPLWQRAAGQRWLQQKCRCVSQRVFIYFLNSFCFFASCSPYNLLEVLGTFLVAQLSSEHKTGAFSRHKLECWRQNSPLGVVLGHLLQVFEFLHETSFWPFPNPKRFPKGTQERKSVIWWVRWGNFTEPPGSLRRSTSSAHPCDKFREVARTSTPTVERPEGWAGHIQCGRGGAGGKLRVWWLTQATISRPASSVIELIFYSHLFDS